MSNKNVMTGGRYGGIGGQWTQLMAFIYMHKPSYTNFCFFMISRGPCFDVWCYLSFYLRTDALKIKPHSKEKVMARDVYPRNNFFIY